MYLKVILGEEAEVIDLEPPKGLKGRSILLRGLNYLLEQASLSGLTTPLTL
jgi:hypothetical protein